MRREHADNVEIECYTPKEFRALLETAEGPMRAMIPKGVDAITLRPFWRMVISGNDDEAGLQICPALSPSLVDKLLILRARRAEGLPVTNEEQDAWAKKIRAELPAFAHWLLRYQPPAAFELSPRTRLPIFNIQASSPRFTNCNRKCACWN